MPEQQSRRESFLLRAFINISAGTVGGIGVCLVGHPFDTIKVRLQTQPSDKPIYRGSLDCLKKTLQWEGVQGLYKGVTSPLVGQMFFRAVLFMTNAQLKASFPDHGISSTSKSFLIGAVTGGVGAFVESPIDLFKSKMQFQILKQQINPAYVPEFRNVFHCASEMAKRYGLRGVFQGLGATIIRNVPANSLYFGFYDIFRRHLARDRQGQQPSSAVLMACGGLAGMMYWLGTFPLDVIKSSLQTDSMVESEKKYRSYVDCAKKLWADGGVRRFYRGFAPCMMRSVPANGVLFVLVENSRFLLEHLLHVA